MDEAIELAAYLPLSFKTQKEQEYIDFLWDAFETNYTHEKCQFAFFAYHMLTMSFVYFNIWQIKQTAQGDFAKAMIGFSKDVEKDLMEATSPFTFSSVNESTVMRLLKLIGCDNAKVGNYAALVKERNETAHANGNIFFNSSAALDTKIRQILRVVDEIQTHSIPTIQCCYVRFLEESCNPDDRGYIDDVDQIREIFIHAHYLSRKDIEICSAFDITAKFSSHAHFPNIQSLHQTLCTTYS